MTSETTSPASAPASGQSLVHSPLTAQEHSLLSMPPQMALIRAGEGTADIKDIWTLWTRAYFTEVIVKSEYPQNLEAIQPMVKQMLEYLSEKIFSQSKDFTMSKELFQSLNDLLDVADQVQQEISRECVLDAYKATAWYNKTLLQLHASHIA